MFFFLLGVVLASPTAASILRKPCLETISPVGGNVLLRQTKGAAPILSSFDARHHLTVIKPRTSRAH